jgi:hypothetical protein
MFNSPILDLVILLSFTYFIGSIMLTSINEVIAATLRLRAKGLKQTLENLVFSPSWTLFVKNTLIKSPHIQALQNDVRKYPSYIPARNFVLTIIEQLRVAGYSADTITTAIKTSTTIPPIFQTVLLDLWDKAQAKATPTLTAIAAFEEELENYYNSAMERASGWYKRRIRRILLTLGIVLATLLNLDTIGIANSSLRDKNKLKNTVDNIVAHFDKINYTDSIITITDTTNRVFINKVFKTDTTKDIAATVASTQATVNDLSIYYKQTTDISLGYKDWNEAKKMWFNIDANNKALKQSKDGWLAFFIKLLGILITAFALQLGSNYWFDILNKAVNMRAAGKKPGEEKSK